MRDTYDYTPYHLGRSQRTQNVLESIMELLDKKMRHAILWEMIKLAGMSPTSLLIRPLLQAFEDNGGMV